MNDLNEDGTYKNATITIYTGELRKDQDPQFDGYDKRFEGASEEEYLNATGTHEREHLTPDQIQRDKKRYSADRDYRGMVEAEKPTLQKEFDTRIQYHKTKGTELPKGIRKVYKFYGIKEKKKKQ